MQNASNHAKDSSGPGLASVVVRLGLLVLGSGLVLGLAIGWIVVPALTALSDPGPASAPELMMALVLAGAGGLGAWLWLLVTVESVTALRSVAAIRKPADQPVSHRRTRDEGATFAHHRIGQRLARRLVLLALGATATGLLGPGLASAQPSTPPSTASTATPGPSTTISARPSAPASTTPNPSDQASATPDSDPSPGWRPSRPTVRSLPDPGFRPTTPSTASTPSPSLASSESPTVAPQPSVPEVGSSPRDPMSTTTRPEQARATVVVLRGDSLWSLAADHLGSGATDGEIADAWPQWYAQNRAVIGENPDLLRPGQVLTVPHLVPGGSSGGAR